MQVERYLASLCERLVCVDIKDAEVEGCFQITARKLVDVTLEVLQRDIVWVLWGGKRGNMQLSAGNSVHDGGKATVYYAPTQYIAVFSRGL